MGRFFFYSKKKKKRKSLKSFLVKDHLTDDAWLRHVSPTFSSSSKPIIQCRFSNTSSMPSMIDIVMEQSARK